MRAFLVSLAALAFIGVSLFVARSFMSDASTHERAETSSAETRPARNEAESREATRSRVPDEARGRPARAEAERPRARREELPSFDYDFDEDEIPSRELVRAAVESAVAEHFTSHRLSSDEVERATDALVTLRETQQALRELPMGPETAEERRVLVERIGEATTAFEDVLDMDPAEFTAAAEPGVGIDRHDPNEVVPPAEFIERPQ